MIGDIQRMDDARDVSEYRQENVDQKIWAAAALKEDTKRWQDHRNNDLDDVAISCQLYVPHQTQYKEQSEGGHSRWYRHRIDPETL